MGRERKMPTPSAIRAYWAPQLVDMDRADSVQDVLDCDWCFACGLEYPWKTERAHILAHCEGGTHDHDNLHLLCPPCHIASELLSGDSYWTWFKERTPLDAVAQLIRGYDSPDRRQTISQRTRAGLAEARRQGIRLGRAPGVVESPPEVVALIKSLRGERLSYRAIAAELNRREVPAPRGRGWNHETVRKAHLSD